jgi:hypothetical protein
VEEYTQVFGWKAGKKETLRSPRCRRENNIKMDLREIELMVWTGSIWLRIGISGGLL